MVIPSIAFLVAGIGLLGTVVGQNQAMPPACTTIVDLAVLLDSSGSMSTQDFQLAKDVIKEIIHRFNLVTRQVHFGYIYYSSNATLDHGFIPKQPIKAIVKAKIDKIPYNGGTTDTGEALKIARTKLFHERRDLLAPRIAVVFKGSYSGEDIDKVQYELKLLQNEGVEVLAFGMGTSNVNQIATWSHTVFQIGSLNTMFDHINQLSQTACHQNALLPFMTLVKS